MIYPISTNLEELESIILISSYELHPRLVVIGQNQPFSIVEVLSSNQEGNKPKVLSSNQVGNELLTTLREFFNLFINLGLDLAIQDPVPLQYFHMGLDNIIFGGVFISLPIIKARFSLISRHNPCMSLHDELLEVKKESSPKQEEEFSITILQTFHFYDSAIQPKSVVLQNPLREEEILPLEFFSMIILGGV